MTAYTSFRELKQNEIIGLDYRIRVRYGSSGLLIMAIHGGGIEPGTTEIAEAAAGDRHTFYTFSGTKKAGNARLHLSSRKFDEPLGVEMARCARSILTIHGCRDDKEMVYLGGRDSRLKHGIGQALSAAGFPVAESQRFPGINPKNICNRNASGMGAQLEISLPLRQRLFTDISRILRKTPTPCFSTFITALTSGLVDPAAATIT